MSREKILIVEDEPDILELVRYNLAKEGYRVSGVASGEKAIVRAHADLPDLILLDLMLPRMDGLEVCKRLKGDSQTGDIPIIMLTAKGEDSDIVAGLELGADDYVVKPFSPKVLIARIRTVLRKKSPDSQSEMKIISTGGITIDPARHSVSVNGVPVDPTATEFLLLRFLASKPGWVFTRNQIIDAIKGESHAVTERSVDVQIVGLRKKLGDSGRIIETVRGVGYRFRESD